jgi:N6-adenosine-specific RNA methylase IME4
MFTTMFTIIYADPPWEYLDKANAGKRGASHKYNTLSVDELCALPVGSLAAPDCLLAMWWVPPMPLEALRVVESWGFKLKTMKGFTWHKRTKHGKSHSGMGNWTRANTEDCLFAVRGRPRRVHKGLRQFIDAPVRAHSEKPDEARWRLELLLGDVPRAELFARKASPGWAVWGNDVESTIKLAPIGNL